MNKATSYDFQFGRLFLTQITQRLGVHLIAEAPMEEDQKHNTDLMVLTLKPYRIACRIRRAERYYPRYAGQFTIRSTRPGGIETELSKMLSGWGDYIFYGFGSDVTKKLVAWFIGDLAVLRQWCHSREVQGLPVGDEIPNLDGSSAFRAFNLRDMPKSFIIARKPEV